MTVKMTQALAMRYGFVCFDEFGDEGWASVSGEDSVRIGGLHDLPSDILWMTNLDFKKMRERGVLGHPNFRMHDFLKTTTKTISADLGIESDVDIVPKVQIISEILHNVCMTLDQSYHINSFGRSLTETVRQYILGTRDRASYGSSDIDYALNDAFQTYQCCITSPSKDFRKFIFSVPKVEYSEYMMSFKVPSGRWRAVELPEDTSDFLEKNWQKTPMLCKISVSHYDDQRYASVMQFGYGRGANAGTRSWAPAHEVLDLMRYANVHVHHIIKADCYTTPKLRIPQMSEHTDRLTYSLGLIGDILWRSITTKGTPMGVWYSSWDRINLRKIVVEIVDAGFTVAGYGSGIIWMDIHTSQRDDFVKYAISELSLIPPLNLMSELEVHG